MSKKLKIGVVSPNSNHGLVYQRVHLPFIHLRDEFDFKFFDVGDLRHSDAFYLDALVFVHPTSDEFLYLAERAKFHYGCKTIVDLDDLLSDLPLDHEAYGQFSSQKIAFLIQAVDHCVFSTKFLATRYAAHNPRQTVIENSISERVYKAYKPLNKPHKNCFIAGWTGGQQHRADQDTFKAGLKQFLRSNADAKSYFHGICPDDLYREFGTQVVFESGYVDYLSYPGVAAAYPFSVCLVGLNKNPFNEAKSDLKLLEMAPHGIPLIASPRSDFIQHAHRQVMLFAEDNSDFNSWEEQLTWAANHPEKMEEMGSRARDYVLSERLSSHAADKWRTVLNNL